MGLHAVYALCVFVALASAQTTMKRCQDYYNQGQKKDGLYDLEVSPRVIWRLYCSGMTTGKPKEYIDLPQKGAGNYAQYYRYQGRGDTCGDLLPRKDWPKWGTTQFTRVAINLDTMLVDTSDFTFSTSASNKVQIPFGQAGDMYYSMRAVSCRKGKFKIDLTGTPAEIDPSIIWSWRGTMNNSLPNTNAVTISSPRQTVTGSCGGFPGECFPALSSAKTVPKLRVRLISNHPCVNPSTENPCKNYGKCVAVDAKAYRCSCLPGWSGATCSATTAPVTVMGPKARQVDDSSSTATCPSGYTLTGCKCSIANCDGVEYYNGNEKCKAVNAGGWAGQVQAAATCNKYNRSLVQSIVTRIPSSGWQLSTGKASYTCPTGYTLVECSWRSPWYSGSRSKYGQGTKSGNTCSVDVKRTGSKAGALYAKCIKFSCLCHNGGTCSGYSGHCICPEGYVGDQCENFDYCAWQFQKYGSPACQNGGSCRSVPQNVIATTGGDGTGKDCIFPFNWSGKSYGSCIANNTVGLPFACGASLAGSRDYLDLGGWVPDVVFTLEGWVMPTVQVNGRRTIFGGADACRDWAAVMYNGCFGMAIRPPSGCSNTFAFCLKNQKERLNQWHHVALVSDGNYMTLYVNGTQRGKKQILSKSIGSAASFRVGGEICCGNNNFGGYVKNLRVWKRSISAVELMTFYKKPIDPTFNITDNVLRRHLISAYEFGDSSPPQCHGKDWGYTDWYPADGEVLSGVHCNVKNFVVRQGVKVTVKAWKRNSGSNTGTGGTFEVYAQNVLIAGELTAKGSGYQGGARPTAGRQSGKQGESFTSASGSTTTGEKSGGGGGGLGDTNSRAYGKPGGGGGYGTNGNNAYDKRNNQGGVGIGGKTYGTRDLHILHLGAGGGSGGNDNAINDNPIGGKGGNGGGAIHLDARNTLTVTGVVSANGEDGQGDARPNCNSYTCSNGRSTTSCWDWSGPGGGGAGGSVYLRGLVVDIGTNRVTAAGGKGGVGTSGCGGNGGAGRIRIDNDKLVGSTNPGAYAVKFNNTFSDLAQHARESLPLSQITSATDQSVYLGCYEDRSHRGLQYGPVGDTNTMTPDKCRQLCYAKGYKYYGLEWYGECFCDNDIGKYSKRYEGDCNTPCNGDKSRICGGGWRMSIYGPKPKSPAVAMVNAVRKCRPWCRNGWSKLTKQALYGLCVGDGHVTGWDIKCTCPPGFNGTRCENSCPPGRYGVGCTSKCNCNNGAACDPVTGACDCPAGFKGKTCSTPCGISEFGPGCTAQCQCATHCTPTSCPGSTKFLIEAEKGTLGAQKSAIVVNNGTASGGQNLKVVGAPQYTASRSSIIATYIVNIAIPGDYYLWLRVVAPHGRADSVWASYNNKGKILFAFSRTTTWAWRRLGTPFSLPKGNIQIKIWIREADVLIDQVFLGQYRAASVCDAKDGSCTCEPGYTGLYCDQACPVGKFGQDCASKCTCSATSVCDPRDGHCLCFAGYTGANCDTKCSGNTYGNNCNQKCTCSAHSTCRHTDGACLCDPGYTGPTCNLLCPSGKYGQNCTKACSCRQSASCDPITGKCLCPPGYTGSDCGQACPVNYYGVDCKQKCACNAASGTCDHVTGKCVCKPGYQGAQCNSACSAGKCGVGCKRNCPCGKGSCVKDDCSCRCWAGWQGANCNTACGQGLYGSDCINKCSCIHGTCNRFNGKCTCQNGWKGASCDTPCPSGYFGKNCASKCKCNSAYTTTCNPIDGSCTCKPGYAGLFCDTQCPAGQFGQNCLGSCGCLNGGVCHSVHGTCDCPRGYYGATCDHVCGAGKYGYNCASTCQCKNGATCDPVDGSCSCPAGYSGDLCDASCSPGVWGPNCNNSCSACVQGTCDRFTGKCTCGDGWTGAACDQPCPSGKYGASCLLDCNCKNGVCDNVDGTCTCDSGFKGSDCATPCDVGTYGVGCKSVCTRKCSNAFSGCDAVDGHCLCKAGYSGPWCNVTCPYGTYGLNCAQTCKSCAHPTLNLACHPVTGQCLCAAGYVGDNCDMPCSPGFWGVNCTEQCTCALLRASCNAADGSCTCLAGYTGDACDQLCPQGFYGVGCSQSCPPCDSRYGYCSPQTGVCQCNPGYTGVDCKTPCSSDKYGPDCAEDCTCLFGTCDPATGRCSCYHGYTGDSCDQTCTNNTYGVDCSHQCSCQNGGTCDAHTGVCYCQPGYYGHDCETPCEDGYYGHLCGRKCECENDATCDIATGFCECKAGFTGLNCDMSCPAGTFGAGCNGACGVCANGVCDQKTGGCTCDPGWEGINCTKPCDKGFYGQNCATPCPDCYNNYACNPVTGHCLCGGVDGFCGEFGICSTGGQCECDAGYTGEDCQSNCPPRTWGYNCSSECLCSPSASCDRTDGTCTCPEGRWGSRCTLECECSGFCDQDTGTCLLGQSESGSSGVSTTVIIVVSVCCVLGGVLIAVVIFAYLRHKAKRDAEGGAIDTVGGKVQYDKEADNVGFNNPIYSQTNEPVKANPIYRSKEDELDDEGDDYTAPY